MWNLQYYRIVFFFAYIIFIGIFRKCECVKLGRWGKLSQVFKQMKFKPVMKVKPGKIFYQKPMTQELKENDDSTIINAPDKPVVETKSYNQKPMTQEQNENDDSTIINAPNTILGDGEGKELEMGTCDEKDQIIKQLTTDANHWRNMKDREEYIATKCKDWKSGRHGECHYLLTSEELEQGISFICLDRNNINWWKQVYTFLGIERDSSSSGDVNLSLIKYYLDLDGLVAFSNSAECRDLWKQDKSCYTPENIRKYIDWSEIKAEDINPTSVASRLEGCWQSPIALSDQYKMRRIAKAMHYKRGALDTSPDNYYLLKDWRFLGSKNSEENSEEGSYKSFLYWSGFFEEVTEGEKWIPGTVAYQKKEAHSKLHAVKRRRLFSKRRRRDLLGRNNSGKSS